MKYYCEGGPARVQGFLEILYSVIVRHADEA